MPLLVSRATGNFTAAATWGVAEAGTGAQLTAPTTTTNTTTSYVYSSTFTGTNAKVVDGIAILVNRLNTTGTFSVALSDDNGVTATRAVTVNASDLPADPAWVFFKFATTLTLDGGTDFRVGILGSSAGNARVFRDATAGNWARIISTTDTAAPAAGDTMLIVGEFTGAGASTSYTVTMDNTATTDFGNGTATATAPSNTSPQNFNGIQIGNKGTLTWGTSAATAYYLKLSGNLIVWDGGTYNMGTVATPCPRDSSMYLQLDCVADGDFGVLFFSGSTANIQGQSRTSGKNIWYCKLNTDEAVNSTSLGVDTDTGWLDNDEIAIATTTRTAAQSEAGTLNGAAGASTLTVDGFGGSGGGLAFDHSGTSPTQAEVILLTRNVRISGGSSTLMSYIYIGNTANCDFDWAELFWIGADTGLKYGIFIDITTGSFNMQFCCVRNTERGPINQGQVELTGTITISNNAFWRTSASVSTVSFAFVKQNAADTVQFSGNIIVYPGGGTGFTFTCWGAFRIDNNTIAGCTGSGFSIGGAPISFSGNVCHSGGGVGVNINANSAFHTINISNLSVWRMVTSGINYTTGTPTITTIDGFTAFANGSYNINLPTVAFVTIRNGTFAGDAPFGSSYGLGTANSAGGVINLINCTFGVASGIFTAHAVGDIGIGSSSVIQINMNNVALGSPTEILGASNLTDAGFAKSSKHDQTEGAFKSWFRGGVIERDTTIFNTAAPSERLTPSSATIKLASGPRLVAVDDGSTVTINAYVRKSTAGNGAAYNGNQPRLIVKANPACGINSDTVLDTMTVGTGTWEQLTGTTAAVDADGALEFVVDCDGTAGWINVDDWTVT